MPTRSHNFFAGPAVLPVPVIEEASRVALEFGNLGMSILEISHRSKEFDAVMLDAQNNALKIMGLSPDEYAVVFVGGGASLQFAMVPMNFMQTKADYVNTGEWSTKAIKEAKLFGEVNVVATSEPDKFKYIPKDITYNDDADYVHITTNNTIYGSEWSTDPVVKAPLIADMSSDMLGRVRDFKKYSLIYAGAQKNLGPSGVVMIVVKKEYVEQKAKTSGVPTMLKYKTHVDKGSMYNTPPVYAVFVVNETLKWIMKEGGLEAVEARNFKKAKLIYDMFDGYPEFYKGVISRPEDRSLMNITWNLPTPELEEKFVAEAKALKMFGLKGHRSVGGLRASTYNACPVASVEALVKFMEEFYAKNK
jgi:phosphoserine aminotransferase